MIPLSRKVNLTEIYLSRGESKAPTSRFNEDILGSSGVSEGSAKVMISSSLY